MGFQSLTRAALLGAVIAGAVGSTVPLVSGAPSPPRADSRLDGAPSHPPGARFLSPAQAARRYHEFYFTRAAYSGRGRSSFGFFGRGRGSWATDFPKADRQFMVVLSRLIDIDASPDENAIRLDDPDVRRFPFLYALEVGGMSLNEAEIEGLRSYLAAGGFLVIDDFWGPYEWEVFEREIRRVLPGREIYEIPKTHAVFNNVYDVANVVQVPNVSNGQRHGLYGTPTNEGPGSEVAQVFGIDDDRGELMVLINWNTDLGDAWEWAENPYYPLKFSTYAFEMGVNMIVYAMSH
jgi:hypothetical protein